MPTTAIMWPGLPVPAAYSFERQSMSNISGPARSASRSMPTVQEIGGRTVRPCAAA
ncbi:hypothetical protein [Variovorax sp. TBS-050B]|uniref:hypothetical protein n=1 Tax=Variovorax sp. TBS-050B TaxID=2940551 RepID=UPI002475A056|nr:hypothetical protein [Variovorax sp. TBS-050B]